MSGPYSQEQYERAKASLADPALAERSRQIRSERIRQYEEDRARGYLPAPADEGRVPQPAIDVQPKAKKPKLNAAQMQGYEIDLSSDTPLRNMADDPERSQFIANVAAATRDEKLRNASKLKVFNDPADYEGKPMLPGLMGGLPKPRQYFYEPSVSEFREVINSGALSKQLQREFSLVDDISKVSDKDLEESTTFKAYQDAAWKHALADAMRTGTPISRVAHSEKLGPIESFQAKALDPVTSFNTGVISGSTLGISDPAIRAVAPETAEAQRRSRLRNPNAALGGEIVGALNPRGAPAKIAAGTTRLLGKLGLGSKGLGGVTRGVSAGAVTGGVDANMRAIAQSASDALDAGDSAVEAASRVYSTLKPDQMIDRTLEGMKMGALMGAGGELLGAGARSANRAIVGGNPRDILLHGQASGIKMAPLGGPKVPADLERLAAEAAEKNKFAENVIAEDLVEPLSRQRLLEQEARHRGALAETASARDKLKVPSVVDGSISVTDATVPTAGAAERIMEISKGISDLTEQGGGKANELRAIARKLASRRKITAAQLDADLDVLEARAKSNDKQVDEDFLAAKKVLLDLRDEFQFPDEATAVDNFAIRDKEGNVKAVDGYSAVKAGQSRDKARYETENAAMGFPVELKAAPVRLGKPPDADAATALAESLPPEVAFRPHERELLVKNIASSGDPANAVRHEQFRDIAARAGLGDGEKLKDISRLRAAQNWKQYLGRAISGIGTGGGAYVKANNLLRIVPALNSFAGGAPKLEATQQAVDVVDRFIAQSVPSGKWAHLRGGQGARPAGAYEDRDKKAKVRDTMTEEEARFAANVIKKVLEMEQ